MRLHEGIGYVTPTTNTTAAAKSSEPHAEPDWPPPAGSALPPTVSYDRITHDRPPVVGYYDRELVHLVRRTSVRRAPHPSHWCDG